MSRTMGEIAERYEAKREEILRRIRDGEISASMSGIDSYPKPWSELDYASKSDRYIIQLHISYVKAS